MLENIHSWDVANYFLANVEEEAGDSISNLKLQKLVYFAQGLYLGMQDEPLFLERIEAWPHGPVVPELYDEYKHRGNRAIEPPDKFEANDYAPEVREILDAVLTVYGQYSAWKLRDLTYGEPPWRNAPHKGEITQGALHEYFLKVVDHGREDRAYPGEPLWPTNSFQYQRRKEIMRRAPERGRLNAARSKNPQGTSGSLDLE